jgi:hypothetical protein
VFGNAACHVVVLGYDDDGQVEDFYDGHLTNAAAYDSPELEGVVYLRVT